jgi:hypothetical protein
VHPARVPTKLRRLHLHFFTTSSLIFLNISLALSTTVPDDEIVDFVVEVIEEIVTVDVVVLAVVSVKMDKLCRF